MAFKAKLSAAAGKLGALARLARVRRGTRFALLGKTRDFIRTFEPKRVGDFTIMPTRAYTESFCAISIVKGRGILGRTLYRGKFRFLPNNPYCIVRGLQGAPRAKRQLEIFKRQTGEHPANFILREIVDHSRRLGLKGVLLLKPGYNRDIVYNHSKEEIRDIEKQYFAAAGKLGFKEFDPGIGGRESGIPYVAAASARELRNFREFAYGKGAAKEKSGNPFLWLTFK
jgi:hypothetical protein